MKKKKSAPDVTKKDVGAVMQRDFGMKSDIFVCLMFSVFPLIIHDYSDVTATKYVAFLVLTLLFLAVLLFTFAAMMLDGYRVPKRRFQKSFFLTPDFFLLLFVGLGVVSFLFSPYKGLQNGAGQSVFLFGSGRYDGFITLVLYVALFFVLSRFGNFTVRHVVICAVTALLMCTVTILQIAGINVLDLYPQFIGGINKFTSTVGNLGMFSGIFCLFIPLISVAQMVLDCSRLTRALLLVTQFVSVVVVLELGVSAGVLALAVTVAVIVPLSLADPQKLPRVWDFLAVLALSLALSEHIRLIFVRRLEKTVFRVTDDNDAAILLGFAVLFVITRVLWSVFSRKTDRKPSLGRAILLFETGLLLIFLCVAPFLPKSSPTHNGTDIMGGNNLESEVHDVVTNKVEDSSGSYRIGIWKNAWELALEHPVFGTGIGTFLETFENHIAGTPLAERLKPTDVAHNEYLHLFCTMGAGGLLAYLGFLITLAVSALKRVFKDPRIVVLGAAVLCYCVQAFFSFNIVIVTPLFWVCAGLLYKIIRNEECVL